MLVTRNTVQDYFASECRKWTARAEEFARAGKHRDMQCALRYAVMFEKASEETLLCFAVAHIWNDPYFSFDTYLAFPYRSDRAHPRAFLAPKAAPEDSPSTGAALPNQPEGLVACRVIAS